MRIVVKIVVSFLALTALGFCVAFVMEEVIARSRIAKARVDLADAKELAPVQADVLNEDSDGGDWKRSLQRKAVEERAFADLILDEGDVTSRLLLEAALGGMEMPVLENHFVELMARDLDDRRAVEFAGRVLREIAQRDPQLGVALLYATSATEKEKLVPSLAAGWVLNDAQTAFTWIESAWIDEAGGFIDRDLQNALYGHAMETLVSDVKDYDLAASVLENVVDPDLRKSLVERVASGIVADGPEVALERIAETGSGVFDTAVIDAIAREWAARDSVGAMNWTLVNQAEMSNEGVRSIAKQLVLNTDTESLVEFHQGLVVREKRDSVAAEAARLHARREPIRSADWAIAIEQPQIKQQAVFDALYEIGYETLGQSVDYIDYVYANDEQGRGPVLYSTLKDWLAVDLDAVIGYLDSGRARLERDLSADILQSIAALNRG